MLWFEGSIAEAVSASKARNAIFVVFIEGTDEESLSTAAAIANPDVSSKLESKDFVSIRLVGGTEEYKLFTEIYRIVPIPSVFFIGGDGRPIEIIAGSANAEDILKRIATVLSKPVPSTPSAPTITMPAASESDPPVASSSADAPTPSPQDILDKAKALMEKSRQQKANEEKAREKEREEERRRVGKEVQELRRWQQEQEMKQMKEDRDREKREDLAARERVKQQIAFDKAERLKKSNEAAGIRETEKAEKVEENVTPPPTASSSNIARLQLRMPNGSVVTTQLSATAPLSELRTFVSEYLKQPPRDFMMSTTFPRRELAASDDAQTMAELCLTPTAVVLVLPSSSGAVVRSGGDGTNAVSQVTWLFWTMLAPVFGVFNYVRSLVFGGGASSGPTNGGQAALKRQTPTTQTPTQGGPSRGGRSSSETTIRRQGNVHRLAQPQESSDEENNTWNGNSTQQM